MRKSWEQCTNFSNSVVIISPVLVSPSAMKSGVWNSEANGNISQIFSLFFLIRKGFPPKFHWLFISKNQKLIKFGQNKLLNPLQPSVNYKAIHAYINFQWTPGVKGWSRFKKSRILLKQLKNFELIFFIFMV